MRNRILLLTAAIFCCVVTVSCSKDGGSNKLPTNGKTYPAITSLDIADANYLYAVKSVSASGSRTRSTVESPTALYKILASGTTEEVKLQASTGETIPIEDIMINKLNDDIIFFGYSYPIYGIKDNGEITDIKIGQEAFSYYVNTTTEQLTPTSSEFNYSLGWYAVSYDQEAMDGDGLVVQVAPEPWQSKTYYDKYQNIYLLDAVGGISKIAVSNGNVTEERIGNGMGGYAINKLGTVLYSNGGEIMCKPLNGVPFRIEADDVRLRMISLRENSQYGQGDYQTFMSLSNETNNFLYVDGDGYGGKFYKVSIDADAKKAEFTLLEDISGGFGKDYGGAIVTQNAIVVIGTSVVIVHDFDNIEIIDSPNFHILHYHNRDLFYLENNTFKKYHIDTKHTETIHTSNYIINEENIVFVDDLILFRIWDEPTNRYVIGQIKDGAYSEQEVSWNTEIADIIKL